MKNEFIEAVYYTLRGQLKAAYQVPGVENAFSPGSPCSALYKQMYDAKRRLEQRLGVAEDDVDIEEIIDALLDIQLELCCRMYCYGAEFGIRDNERTDA